MDAAVIRQILQTNVEEAAIYIVLDYLLPELRKRKLVTDLEFRQLCDENWRSSDEKNRWLLRLIETKGGEKSFDLFVQALEAEKQHTGHEHLAKELRKAKAHVKAAAIKGRSTVPPTLPPKPKKTQDPVESPRLSSSGEYLALTDQMRQIDSRFANLENDVSKIKKTVTDSSLERKIDMAMQALQDKVDALNALIESHRTNYKCVYTGEQKSIPIISQSISESIPANVGNDYAETQYAVVGSQLAKIPDVTNKGGLPAHAYTTLQGTGDHCSKQQYEKLLPHIPNVTNKGGLPAYTTLQGTSDHRSEQKYDKLVPRQIFNQDEYVETNLLTKGSNGEFWLAVNKTDGTKVVIKKPAEYALQMLGQEVHVLSMCHHPNIVRLISPILSQQVPSLVFEYVEKGQLREYLRNEKDGLCELKLIAMATNVACGMAELERQGFVHCNLKASNILVDSYFVCKIGSFSKVLCLKRNEKYKICNLPRLAIRWQAPEVLSDFKFSSKSDVWSFGVFLSELFTYGDRPYPDMKPDQVKWFVLQKNKMNHPSGCPKDVYKLMKECFDADAEKRPSFDALHIQLTKLQTELYRRSDDSVEYTSVHNAEKRPSIDTSPIQLTKLQAKLYRRSDDSVTPYDVTITGETLFNRGERLELNCSSKGGPVLKYTWIFSGNIIPNANTSTLTIDAVNTTHAGDYTCNVTNDTGTNSDTITVYIAPYNVVIMGDYLYNQGEQLQLNCSSEGGPILEYTWIFLGNIIPNANTNTLTINAVNTTHAGDYTCNVTNDAGTDSDTITVYIAPYNVVIMGDSLYNQGEQLQLNCSSEGGPILEYTWIFSGNIIPNGNTNTLTIDNVNTTHAGDYTCNVTNDAGTDSGTITIYTYDLHYGTVDNLMEDICPEVSVSAVDNLMEDICSEVSVSTIDNLMEDMCPEVSVRNKKCKTTITVLVAERLSLLTALNVSGCNITDKGANMLATVLLLTVSIEKIDLSNTALDANKAAKINNSLKNNMCLKIFNISNNEIDDDATDSIVTVIYSNCLIEKVNLSNNKLSYTGILSIVTSLPFAKNFRVLDISNNFIRTDNITDLATALSKCTMLEQLNISHNLLSFGNVLIIAQSLRSHPALQALYLNGNITSFSSICEFVVDIILSVNQALLNLNVCGRNIRPRYVKDYLSPPSFENISTKFTFQKLYLLQHSSLEITNTKTKFIKVTENCPLSSEDVISYYVDYLGDVFYNQYHNFTIVIPPGAVSPGECIEIQATANYFSPFIIPDGFYPISSYVWISANYEFKAPVYLIMNHYAKIRNLEDIGNLHILQTCTHDSDVKNCMMTTIANGVYFDIEIGYCVLATKHFCSYCQAKTIKHIPEYLLACYCTYDDPSTGSLIAEVCFCPSNSDCKRVILEQCNKRNTKLQHSETFDIADGEVLYISSIDFSNVNNHEWILDKRGKLNITHLRDFEYWRIFHGLTVEQIKEREESFDYPPRLQMKCEQIDASKSLFSSFEVSKKNKNMKEEPIARFSLVKKVSIKAETQQHVQQPSAILPASIKHKIFLFEPEMHELNKTVISKVSAEWEDVAYALEYQISTVQRIRNKHNVDPKKCCRELFEDWLTTSNGAKPKIWKTLLDKIKEIDTLDSVAKEITEKLINKNLQA